MASLLKTWHNVVRSVMDSINNHQKKMHLSRKIINFYKQKFVQMHRHNFDCLHTKILYHNP